MIIDAFPEQLNEYISQLRVTLASLKVDSLGGSMPANNAQSQIKTQKLGQTGEMDEVIIPRELKINEAGIDHYDGLIGLLLAIESIFSASILSNLIDGETQLVDCFARIVNPTLSAFRKLFPDEDSLNRTQWELNFHKLCKHFSIFLRELLKRLNQVFGSTEQLRSIIDTLGPYIVEDPDVFKASQASSSNEVFLNKIYGHALCKLGDLSRYRATYRDPSDYKHAFAYYKACVAVWKGDGMPWNQMGVIYYSQKEYIDAYYCFNKSLCILHPFKDSNMISVLKKFLKSNNDAISMKEDDSTGEAKLAIYAMTKRVAEYDFLYAKSNSMMSNPLDQTAEYNEIRTLVEPLLSQARAGHISYKILVRLSILLVMVNWRLSEENIVSEYCKGLFALTMAFFEGLCKIILELSASSSDGVKSEVINSLFPCLRVLFDWLAKDFDEYSFTKDHYSISCLQEVVRVLEWIRETYGFHFDTLTAAAMQSGRASPMALYEEIECFECSALWESLNDTPSGIDMELTRADNPFLFRCQCILFSGVRIGLDRQTFVAFDSVEQQFHFRGPKTFDLAELVQSPTVEASSEMTFSDSSDKAEDEDDDEIVFRPRGN
jgi:tetratricopeptide (TPR) repeat protein